MKELFEGANLNYPSTCENNPEQPMPLEVFKTQVFNVHLFRVECEKDTSSEFQLHAHNSTHNDLLND